jgi:hypothetical protein
VINSLDGKIWYHTLLASSGRWLRWFHLNNMNREDGSCLSKS